MGIDQLSSKLSSEKRPAVFLDRDGVINNAIVREGKPYPPNSLAELEILPGVPEALWRLREAGFCLIVVTNQPDVARGIQTRDLHKMTTTTKAAANSNATRHFRRTH